MTCKDSPLGSNRRMHRTNTLSIQRSSTNNLKLDEPFNEDRRSLAIIGVESAPPDAVEDKSILYVFS